MILYNNSCEFADIVRDHRRGNTVQVRAEFVREDKFFPARKGHRQAKPVLLSIAEMPRPVQDTKDIAQPSLTQEAQRIQRGRHDIRVMVRYPEEHRKSIADIENMRLRLPTGAEIPFDTVAEVKYGRGYSAINRADRARVVYVTSDVDEDVANTSEINAALVETTLPELMEKFPGLKYKFAGEKREREERSVYQVINSVEDDW